MRILIIVVLGLLVGCAQKTSEVGNPTPDVGSLSTLAQRIINNADDSQWHLIQPDWGGKQLTALIKTNMRFLGLVTPLDDKVISPGFGSIFSSRDAVTWDEAEISPRGYYNDAVFFMRNWIAVGRGETNSSGLIITSQDTEIWKERARLSNQLNTLVANDEKVIAAGVEGNILISLDGIDWETVSSSSAGHIYNGEFGNGRFVLIGDTSLLFSEDGRSWTEVQLDSTSPPGLDAGEGLPTGLRNITFGNQTFVIWHSDQIYISTDGDNWQKTATEINFIEIIFADNIFVGFDIDDVLYLSTDGDQWIEHAILERNTDTPNCTIDECFTIGDYVLLAR